MPQNEISHQPQLEEELRPEPVEGPSKPYDQRPDEPDKWYDRFQRFCLMGPSRSILGCYRAVMAERTALAVGDNGSGSSLLPSQPMKVSQSWRQKAREFDWLGRAAAWDADQRELTCKQADEILNRIMKAALDALQVHIDMMYGHYKGPDGRTITMSSEREIRMAAKTLLTKALDLLPLLQLHQAQERPELMINEIRVPLSTGLEPDVMGTKK